MSNEKPHNPIVFFDNANDQELLRMAKSPEDKLYMAIYYNHNTEAYEYTIYTGRRNCYFGIEGICKNHDIDPKDIKVLVEYIVRNRNTNAYEYALMHPDNPDAKTAYQFCKSVEEYFGPNAFDVDQYTDAREGEEDESNEPSLLDRNVIDVNIFEGSLEMANMYADIVREKNESSYDPKSLFQAPSVNPFNKQG